MGKTSTRFGCSTENFAAFETQVGPLRAQRIFFPIDAPMPSEWANVDEALDAGLRVYVSAIRIDAAFLAAIATKYAGERNLYYIHHHEPENDVTPTWTQATFQAEWETVLAAFKGKIRTAVCLMAWTLREGSDGGWFVPGVNHLAVDAYFRSAVSVTDYGTTWPKVLDGSVAVAAAKGVPLYLTEVGAISWIDPNDTRPRYTITEQTQADAIDALGAYITANDVKGACWWESQSWKPDAIRNYEIRDRAIVAQAFARLS